MKELPHTRSCFVCGESNPIGLKLRFHTDGEIVQARFVPGEAHIGFRQTVHGGLMATILDEIMVWACAVKTRRFAYCADLNVRFVNRLEPGKPVLALGELMTNRRDKIYEARAELRAEDGTVLAHGSGKYMPVDHRELAGMAEDFVSDPGWVLGGQGA